MKIHWKEVSKFLSGAFFVTAGASWYLSYGITLEFRSLDLLTMSPEFLGIRGFIHFALFLITVYFGFIENSIETLTATHAA